MSTSLSKPGGFDRREPIPGYKTIDLLGRGGYGEVWRAIAPGGIAKAVKIVFGEGDASHAATEMRALSRVKDVRHPLLLSIERIEVTHNNLVIVTELADYSLKQRFQQLQGNGIPQDEILQYIADSAEALDFLYEKYSLQHLDVKPENILIVGGRAKVGDFGLVKNLYERSASMVGGLTPTYAPPELFEGRPTRHSDQYSLAIVYFQMLTGLLPFAASNMAQLATLHLRGVPDLSALPRRQRTVIARALSKDPVQRFGTCLEMVKALRDAVREVEPPPVKRAEPAADATPARPLTASRGDGELRTIPRSNTQPALKKPEPPAAPETVSVHAATDTERVSPPTILVGVGGAGVEVLAKLVRRLNDRFGRADAWPEIEFLAFDANTRTLTSHFSEDDLSRVRPAPIPLKPAESYGEHSAEHVKWLGRRWFYNIPRDLGATGYRPLGRLALVSHAARVREAIASVVQRAAERSKGDGAAPRVLFVGAIGGGVGGGALLDAVYALRSELKRRGLSDEHVHGVLLYATPRSNADRDRARANAYSTLAELHHFSQPGSHYPGEPLLAASPFHGDNATFGRTHFLHLGEGLGQAEWDLATDQIAEFLFAMTLTPARLLLEGEPSDDAGLVLRPHDVLALGAGIGPIIEQAVRQACTDVIHLWREGRRSAPDGAAPIATDRTVMMNAFAPRVAARPRHVEESVKRQLSAHRLDAEGFRLDAIEVLKLETGTDVPELVKRLVDDAVSATHDIEGPNRAEAAFALLDRFLECETEECFDNPAHPPLYVQLLGRLGVRTRGRIEPFLSEIRSLVDSPDGRIEGARQTAAEAQRALLTIQESVTADAAERKDAARKVVMDALNPECQKAESRRWSLRRKGPESRLRESLTSYSQARLDEVLRRCAAKMLRIIGAELSTMIEALDRLSRELTILAEPARGPHAVPQGDDGAPESGGASPLDGFRRMMLAQLGQRRVDLARRIEEALESNVFAGGAGLKRFLEPDAEMRKTLWRPLSDESRQAVLECVREISCQMISGGSDASPSSELISLLAASVVDEPRSPKGEVVRRVLIVPDEVDIDRLRERLRSVLPNVAIVRGRKCDVTLCTLRREKPIDQAADGLIAGVPLYKDLAERLHTRIDIAWKPFVDPETPREPAYESAEPCTRTAVLPV